MSESVKAVVDGGAASAGPPLGPALGPLGVNTGEVVKQINELTANFKGMKIPIEVIVDPATKEFEIKVGSPPTSALILKAIGIERGGGNETAGDIKIQDILQIAKDKEPSLLAKDTKAALKEIVGSCQSLKVTIEGRPPKIMIEDIEAGMLDKIISGEETEMPEMTEHEKEEIAEMQEIQDAKDKLAHEKEEAKLEKEAKKETPAEEADEKTSEAEPSDESAKK